MGYAVSGLAGMSGSRAVAQFGSALDWGSRGRRFKSCQPDKLNPALTCGNAGSEPVLHLNPKALFPTYSQSIGAVLRICLGQLVQDVRDVSGDRRLGDVELARDRRGGVAELLGGGLGVDPLRDQGRHRLAKRVGRDPVEAGVLRICRSVQEEAYAPDEGAFGACASAPNTVAQSFAMLTMVHPWRVATSVIGSGSAKVSAEPT